MVLRNVGILPQHYTASQPRRPRLKCCGLVLIVFYNISLNFSSHTIAKSQNYFVARFEAFTAVKIRIEVLWV
jgi:hypothetical protein